MAGLPLPPVPFIKTFANIVADYAAAAQGSSSTPLDFSEGSVFLALAEATAGNVDWLQKLYLFTLLTQRLYTSQGPWVDTWTADYMPAVPGTSSPRLPAAPASGAVTFSRANPQSQAIVPVGAQVASFDGSQVYQVNADTTNSAYSATIIPGGGFIIPAGQEGLDITVTALNPSTAANVQANTITLLQSSVVGVDTVNNAAPLTTGSNPESDAALKARFVQYIASLSKATDGAIAYSITSLQQGLQVAEHDNVDPNGATDYGNVVVYVDDGSGNPSSATVQAALAAATGVKAAGVRIMVLGATTLVANVSMTIVSAVGYYHPTVIAAVGNAIGAYIDSLGIETTLPFTELIHVAYSASPGVTNVIGTTLNGGTSDLVPGFGQTIKLSNLSIQ
jgi:uncharacterized phage protein gp47/JayE